MSNPGDWDNPNYHRNRVARLQRIANYKAQWLREAKAARDEDREAVTPWEAVQRSDKRRAQRQRAAEKKAAEAFAEAERQRRAWAAQPSERSRSPHRKAAEPRSKAAAVKAAKAAKAEEMEDIFPGARPRRRPEPKFKPKFVPKPRGTQAQEQQQKKWAPKWIAKAKAADPAAAAGEASAPDATAGEASAPDASVESCSNESSESESGSSSISSSCVEPSGDEQEQQMADDLRAGDKAAEEKMLKKAKQKAKQQKQKQEKKKAWQPKTATEKWGGIFDFDKLDLQEAAEAEKRSWANAEQWHVASEQAGASSSQQSEASAPKPKRGPNPASGSRGPESQASASRGPEPKASDNRGPEPKASDNRSPEPKASAKDKYWPKKVDIYSHDRFECCWWNIPYEDGDAFIRVDCRQFKDPRSDHDGRNADIQRSIAQKPDFPEFLLHVKKRLWSARGMNVRLCFWCNHGKHRSVACAELLYGLLNNVEADFPLDIEHLSLFGHNRRHRDCRFCECGLTDDETLRLMYRIWGKEDL